MTRPRDDRRRDELLAAAFDHAAAHGLATLSLRPLARAIGTSDRMLVHYFGSKDELVTQMLERGRPSIDGLLAASPDLTPRALAHHLWSRMTGDGDQAPRVRLMLEAMALALHQPEKYARIAATAHRGWVEPVTEALAHALGVEHADAAARATVLVSGLKGLALDVFVTGDRSRADAAAALLIDAATA